MIVPMQRLRFFGPVEDLPELLQVLQQLEVVHLGRSEPEEGLQPVTLTPFQERRVRQLRSILEDCESVLDAVGWSGEGPHGEAIPLPRAARLARRLRRRTDRLHAERGRLESLRRDLERYGQILAAFDPLLRDAESELVRSQLLLLRPGAEREADRIEAELDRLTGGSFELRRRSLDSGETALLVLVPRRLTGEAEALWKEAAMEEIRVPRPLVEGAAGDPLARIEERLQEVTDELEGVDRELQEIVREHGPVLHGARGRIRDLLSMLDVLPMARRTRHAFLLDGWVPEAALSRVRRRLAEEFGSEVAVEVLGKEPWEGEPPPVVLSNPSIFRPFEALVRPFPLPRYGSLDPTPFVAVFFPMFFGLILGDVGYGFLLAAVGLGLEWTARGPGLKRDVARIALSCSAFSIIFGLLYGELFGDLGHRWLGLEPLWFDRGEAVLPFLGLALAVGFVHLVLGLVVGAAAAWRGDRRRAVGRGLAALLVVASGAALLMALEILPPDLLTPLVIGIFVLFPVLVVVEGIIAPIELLSTLGHVLSYARIMAIGTASVMLAVVANRMVGAMGSVVVGVIFALLFHLVNFALGVFSPTIHALRLHYVEFFGTFYSPGGAQYTPLARWRPETHEAP